MNDDAGAPQQVADPNSHLDALSSPQPPKYKDFSTYTLLSQPEPGSLFGTNRPHNWSEVKSQLAAALRASSAKADDPIHKWLETFAHSFDERSTAVVLAAVQSLHRPDQPAQFRYEPELFDMLLQSAATQLDRCLSYRLEMGSHEVAGVNAGISYLSFLSLRPIQRNIILQNSSEDLDAIANAAEQRSSKYFGKAADGISGVFDKFHMLGLQSDADGTSRQANQAGEKEQLRTALLEKQLNLQSDAQLAVFTRMLTPGTSANSAERYLRLLSMLTEDLADAYCKLVSASKGVQQVMQMNNVSVGLNASIPVDIPAFANAAGVQTWVARIVSEPGDERQPDVLDALVLWCRGVMRELDRRSQYETEFTLPIPLSQITGIRSFPILDPNQLDNNFFRKPTQIMPTYKDGKLTFDLDTKSMPFGIVPSNLRVVGIGVSIEHNMSDASPVQYNSGFPNTKPYPVVGIGSTPGFDASPPAEQSDFVNRIELIKMVRFNVLVTTPTQNLPDGTSYQRPSILLTNVRLQGGMNGDIEPSMNYSVACRNFSPFGTWALHFDKQAVTFFPSGIDLTIDQWLQGVILHLRLRGSSV